MPRSKPVALAPIAPKAVALPASAASVQATPSLWHLGIVAQELTARIARLAEQLEAEDPEQQQAAIKALEEALLMEEGNREALARKADATCWVIDHLRAQGNYRQQQAKRLVELAKCDQRRADALETTLVFVLTRLQPAATRSSFPHHELTSRRSEAVEISAEEELAPEWLRVTTATAPDKGAIKAALKAGQQIQGAQLVSRRSWSIHCPPQRGSRLRVPAKKPGPLPIHSTPPNAPPQA